MQIGVHYARANAFAAFTGRMGTVVLEDRSDLHRFRGSCIGLYVHARTLVSLVSHILFSAGPISGWWTDRWGAEWITFLSMVLAIPWIAVIIIDKSLALFIVGFALQST